MGIWTHTTRLTANFYWNVCSKPGKSVVMYLCASFCYFSIRFCSDSVVFFVVFFLHFIKRSIFKIENLHIDGRQCNENINISRHVKLYFRPLLKKNKRKWVTLIRIWELYPKMVQWSLHVYEWNEFCKHKE